MAKVKADSTMVKELTTELEILKGQHEVQIKQLNRELESAKSTSSMWYNQNQALSNEIENIHLALDAVPGTVARYPQKVDYNNGPEMKIAARLVSLFASWACKAGNHA